jgi:hypothetical protein
VINAEGDAEYNAPFSVGSHSVTASYSGDNSYNKSTAAAIVFKVVQDKPVIMVGASNQYSSTQYIGAQNQPTVVNVQVENNAIYNSYSPVPVAPPTGTITVSGFPSGVPTSAALSAAVDPATGAPEGVATFTIPASTSSGTYSVTVNYPGDANYAANSGTATVQVVGDTGGFASTTTATMSGSISPTTSITINGTVTGQSGHAAPTGDVFIFSSGYGDIEVGLSTPASGVVSSFSFTLNSQYLFQGANFITLQYTGDKTYYPSAFQLSNPIANPLSDFTLTPETTIVPVLAGSSSGGSTTINLASVNGFSGNVALTCTPAVGITCTISPTEGLSGGGSAAATLTINAGEYTANLSYNVQITGTDATGKYVHTLGIEAVVSGSPAGSTSFVLSNSGNLTLAPGATTGNTSTITVTPLGAFTGTVGLTCAVTGPPIPSGYTAPTCSLASPSVASGSGMDVLTVTTTSTTYSTAYTVTVTGTSGVITQTTALTVNVGTPSFALTNGGSITVSPGAMTGNTSTITITPSYAFTGTVSLSCAIALTAASDPATCSVSAPPAITGSAAVTATLTVNTTAATTALNQTKKLFWPSAGGAALALVLFFGIPKRRRNWLAMLGLLVFFVTVAGMGCGGGGGSGGGGGNSGTTAGTYTVTVTGTSGTGASAITQTTAVTLIVN